MQKDVEFEYKAKLTHSFDKEAFVGMLFKDNIYSRKALNIVLDRYYDTPKRELFVKGVFVRERDGKRIEIKYSPNLEDKTHTSADEYKCKLPLQEECGMRMLKFLSNFLIDSIPTTLNYNTSETSGHFGLSDFVKIKKKRLTYENSDITVCFDDVEMLGSFIEVEVRNLGLRNGILQMMKNFGLKHISTGYVELYLRKYDYKTYINGRHLLEEDRTSSRK
ncbi:CYTH domain-containing protein [Thiolapillus sp.]|uniref:CYTH domain-containing protein n=2 Tax=Thiolapillus sp. TaxID=2017437 RepID=UPI0026015074|nr:CYTH domain-containing protein [Thiolapillus sp.]